MGSSTQGDPNCATLMNLRLYHTCAALTVSVCILLEYWHLKHKKEKNNVLLFMENSYYVHRKL